MNPEVKEKWLEALKSGEYKKGKYCLKNNDEFCCLGVLCDISGLSDWSDEIYDGARQCLPIKVEDWSDIHYQNTLIEINDNSDDWDEIIEYIEEKL